MRLSLALIFLIILSGFAKTSLSQQNTDSLVLQYLRTLKDIPAPKLETIKKKNKVIRSANFFVEELDSIKSKNINFRVFIFGSAVSHSRKYLLIEVYSNNSTESKVFDDKDFETAINSLFSFVNKWNLQDTEKATLVRGLTYTYN